MNAPTEGWFPDPTGHHQYRYWNGLAWGDHVSDQGQMTVDPVPVTAPVTTPRSTTPPITTPAITTPLITTQAPPPPPLVYTPSPGQQPPPPPPPLSFTPTASYSPAPTYATPPAPPAAAKGTVAWLTVAGAVIAGLSAPLDWLDTGFVGANGFDVPAVFLIDKGTSSDSVFSVGLVVVVLAAAALLAGLVHSPGTRALGRIAGGLLVSVGLLYIFQLYGLADDLGSSVTDLIGFAPLLTVVGGALVAATSKR